MITDKYEPAQQISTFNLLNDSTNTETNMKINGFFWENRKFQIIAFELLNYFNFKKEHIFPNHITNTFSTFILTEVSFIFSSE